MKTAKSLGIVFITMLATGAMLASTTLALPELLPRGKYTGKNVAGAMPGFETLSGTSIWCSEVTASGEDISDTSGKYVFDIAQCKTPSFFNVSCNTKGDSAGIILVTGEYRYVYDAEKTGVAVLLLPSETTVECSTFLKWVLKRESANGGLVCLISEPAVKKTTHRIKCEGAKGDQSEKTYFNDNKESVKAQPVCSINGGAFEGCDEILEWESTYKEANAFEEV